MGDKKFEKLTKLVRYYILESTTSAGSGHVTSSLSSVELMTGLMFGKHFKYDVKNPKNPNNDRLIFSKGHASPLLYSLWSIAGVVSEKELLTLRDMNSRLEGHPTLSFPYTEAATGSLGQGLSIGVGQAINAKYLDHLPYKTYVLLGDSEMSEGSNWEAMQIASYYKLNNLIGIIDVNRLGQRGQTMLGHDIKTYKARIESFGWYAISIDGHSIPQVLKAYSKANKIKDKPVMIIAKTIKGKGISFLEDKNGWHGRALNKDEYLKAVIELGQVTKNLKQKLTKPLQHKITPPICVTKERETIHYSKGELFAPRKAYGHALVRISSRYPNMVVLDAETSNSTYAITFKDYCPERFFEMFINEQNMVGTALGLSLRGKIPFISTFAAFFTRAHGQIRVSEYNNANIKFVGSHAGVSIGEDGSSQMGLEDLSLFRSVMNCKILYPSDAVSTEKCVELAAKNNGMFYIRTTRQDLPVLYDNKEVFKIGGSKTLQSSNTDFCTIISAGITIHEALKASIELKKIGLNFRIIDAYSITPIDSTSIRKAVRQTKNIIVVEDHLAQGGLGDAVQDVIVKMDDEDLIEMNYEHLCVKKIPHSGTSSELLDYEEINSKAIVKVMRKFLK